MVDKAKPMIGERNGTNLPRKEEAAITDHMQCGGLAMPNDVIHTSGNIDPSSAGFAAGIGSTYDNTTSGLAYKKTGSGDTDWTLISASGTTGSIEGGTASSTYDTSAPIEGGNASSTY